MKVFVTGGAGFMGSNFIIHVLGLSRDYSVVNYDKLTYRASRRRKKVSFSLYDFRLVALVRFVGWVPHSFWLAMNVKAASTARSLL
jgi:nucleoside-diphosphate-sugar epimerase